MTLFSILVCAAPLPVFLPVHLLAQQAQAAAGARARRAPRVEHMLARDPTTADLPSARHVEPPVELDHLEHHSSATVGAMVLDSAREAARALTGESDAQEVSPAELLTDLTTAPTAFLVKCAPDDSAWILGVSWMHSNALWWNPDHFEATTFEFEPARDLFRIHDKHGGVHTPAQRCWPPVTSRQLSSQQLPADERRGCELCDGCSSSAGGTLTLTEGPNETSHAVLCASGLGRMHQR